MKGWLKRTILGCIILSLISFSLVGLYTYIMLTKPMIAGKLPVIVSVNKNTSAASFVHTLRTKHLINSSQVLLAFIRIKGLAPHLKAGIYKVFPGETTQQFLNKVVTGQVLVESFSIIEGTTVSQIKSNLNNAPFLNYSESDWLNVGKIYSNPEGLLLADTYNYDAGSDAKQILTFAHQKLLRYLDSCWKSRSPGLPYKSPYELLIVASILEKESSLPTERKLIAGVVINRLKKNMPLQMDPTVIYALGPNYRGKLTHDDLAVNSPYNTYRYRGLPPTPIAVVGRDAIEAAAHPQVTDYIYFVAKGDGSHQFSVSYEEQKKAIARLKAKGLS
ncbi:ABC transporter substrate-binding protein [Legionella jamestowniensis]|uniref:Endolytic murein transglycosylase n=1 Tax=Legionella jamestowniensis TaxID=455 RepID=A0ABX2XXZ4_9GAMM|nr:endolytic transglycosylase MltG [Legionella jamestowniensis]OCH99282.1 ABC transporter substrate-binding protein [Legionella jamestowniensis]